MIIDYQPRGVCSRRMTLEVEVEFKLDLFNEP